MAFPDAERVIYDINPLDEVICRVRFPAVLRIDVEPPAAFQERIRDAYPSYRIRPSAKLPSGVSAEVASLFAREVAAGGQTHEFASSDGVWTLSLSRDALALSCRRYRRWEEFKDQFARPLRALAEVYLTGRFDGVSLRYRDLVRRSALGLETTPWRELLKEWLVGPLAEPAVADAVERSVHELVVHLPEDAGHLDAWYGLVLVGDPEEWCYGIDATFSYEQPTGHADAFSRLDGFNTQARLFFRWCIQDGLHAAMRPRPVPPA